MYSSYIQKTENCWWVYMPSAEGLQHVGFAYAGQESACFKTRSGKKAHLFRNLKALEVWVELRAAEIYALRYGKKEVA